eukprot:GFKZ01009265.1.p1 GENE.GFKZ01009265.1~~GFKZ01009265.1.p1  ORF type:complete len:658 (+),score=112.46 GFKZ01009265.1:100-1974(+)
MTSAPPPTHATAANPHSQKYDRQIRIWGDNGQAALQRASVCLINASALGTEILKNIVLPGIGAFTVIDGHDITPADYSNNFFLSSATALPDPSRLSQKFTPRNRALAATEATHELNSSVSAAYIPHHVSSFIRNSDHAYEFFARFSLVVVTQMSPANPTTRHIAAGCYRANVPLLLCRTYGLVGYVRLQVRELCVLDDKQDDAAPDLRLHAPFPQLRTHVDAVDLAAITDSTVASHVPFVTLLVKASQLFLHQHNHLPATTDEKRQFKALINSLRPSCCPDLADNFAEALKMSNMRLCFRGAADLVDNLAALFRHPNSDPASESAFVPHLPDLRETRHLKQFPEFIHFPRRPNRNGPLSDLDAGESSSSLVDTAHAGARRLAEERAAFWVHVAAVRKFYEDSGALPLRGSLPDMTADTESYVALQKVYSAAADKDASKVWQNAMEIMERFGIGLEVDEASVREFCKRVQGIRVVRTRGIVEEMEKSQGDGVDGGYLEMAQGDMALEASRKGSGAAYYALFRAVDKFREEHGREVEGEDDVALVWEYLSGVKEELGVGGGVAAGLWRDETAEMVRYRGGELHNVAAFVGGIAGQEATKVLTRQFVPLGDTIVVNLGEMTSVRFKA